MFLWTLTVFVFVYGLVCVYQYQSTRRLLCIYLAELSSIRNVFIFLCLWQHLPMYLCIHALICVSLHLCSACRIRVFVCLSFWQLWSCWKRVARGNVFKRKRERKKEWSPSAVVWLWNRIRRKERKIIWETDWETDYEWKANTEIKKEKESETKEEIKEERHTQGKRLTEKERERDTKKEI